MMFNFKRTIGFQAIGSSLALGVACLVALPAMADGSKLPHTAEARTVLSLYSAAPVAWNGEMAGMRSRFDELRNSPGSDGVWMRTHGSRANITSTEQLGYEQRQIGLVVGADTSLSEELTVGVLAGSSRSDLDLATATKGAIDSVYLGAYASWMGKQGFYIDTLFKASQFSSRADAMSSDAGRVQGKFHQAGLGGSLEVGRRITLDDGWYVKPYGQFSALAVQGQEYRLSNGLEAGNNAAVSMNGKVGGQFGRRLGMAGGGTLQPYMKAAMFKEFTKTNQVRLDARTLDNNLTGHGGELGLGFLAQLTPEFVLNADFDHLIGQRIEQPFGVSVGLRYAF